MPVLIPTAIFGRVVWLGLTPDRTRALRSTAVDAVEAGFDGLRGDGHAGLTRPSCGRVLAQYPQRGTEIRNTRQVSVLSAEELAETAAALGLEALAPELVGANLVLEGVPALTRLPAASRLVFAGGATLTVDVENASCQLPAREIEAAQPGHGAGYKAAARGRRGVTAWVERPGTIRLGETARLHAPRTRPYPPLAPARGAASGPPEVA